MLSEYLFVGMLLLFESLMVGILFEYLVVGMLSEYLLVGMLSEYLVVGIWWLLLLARGMSAINLGCTAAPHSPAQMFSLLVLRMETRSANGGRVLTQFPA